MEEYITITEAARRIGMSDKTVRRAIRDNKLPARYPQPNKAEVSTTDLEAWHATLHVRPSEAQDRLRELEERVTTLEVEIQDLRRQLEVSSVAPKKKAPVATPTATAPEGFTYLSDFCTLHHVPYQTAEALFPHMIRGQKIMVQRRNQPIIGPKGKHDFWVQLHTREDFVACDDCPHAE